MFEIIIVALLILLNGVFALSELAVVSSRRARLRSMAEAGRAGAKAALELSEDPGRFLSTVQIGITLIGILAGAYSGSALGEKLSTLLQSFGVEPGMAQPVGIGLVVTIITYFSLVIGELVPKQLALGNPERIACLVAGPMRALSRVAAPFVVLLDLSSRFVFFLLRVKQDRKEVVTEEEIRSLIAEAERAGVIEADERRLISGVFRFGDRKVKALMTPRTDVERLSLAADDAAIREKLLTSSHTRLPVSRDGSDDMAGIVVTSDLVKQLLSGEPLDIEKHIRPAPVIPDTASALDLLELLRSSEEPMALVHDEYGDFEGIVTPADVLGAIAGAFRSDLDEGESEDAFQREDGSWLIAGSMPAEDMAETIGMALPAERGYNTTAGFMLSRLGHLPVTGEHFSHLGWRFEVVDMDGLRIDKVHAQRLNVTTPDP
ncbi:Magnesium and cobalt efflux protein CorC [Hartmannibacter diazotrophicus]|uniref:Magnesium and cobalt efflux protein CorC n=1 Tax=Hartmannibacter diazotrophicus TaxID=1482074 RepID=A0A2C9D3K0_9HYPH|nr:hemolysin family protein [Hartmannibacter diazotrophicus]SON54840.1 Magnesium and cobalt efflux protein CorC [Hartmannibacter diazotrophicus]